MPRATPLLNGGQRINYWADKLGMSLEEQLDPGARKKLVEDAVPSSVAADRNEIIQRAQSDLNFFAALAMPDIFKHEFPVVHLTAWQLLTENADKSVKLFPQIALGIPRGHAKTTLVKLFLLWSILYTKKKFPLVIGSTASNAENILADVVDMLDEPNIVAVFGDWKHSREISRQDLVKFSFRGRTLALGAIGAGGSIRGLNVRHSRPDIIVFEDVQTKECSESQVQSEALERWMIGTAMKAKSPEGCVFIFVGNMYPGPNSILKKLKANPTWIKFISGAVLTDGTALWPQLHSIADLIKELDNDLSMGHPEIFFSEVLNDTDAGVNSRTDLSLLGDWPFTEIDKPQGKFIIIDPATDKKDSDAVAIGLFEVYDGVPALVELVEESLSPGNTIRRALLMALKNRCRLVAIEATSYQYTLLYWFNEVCTSLNIQGIEVAEIQSGAISKNSRINSMLKSLTSKEILLHPTVRPLVEYQIANWSPLKKDNVDNALDLLAYSAKVLEKYPAAIMCDDSFLLSGVETAAVQDNNTSF